MGLESVYVCDGPGCRQQKKEGNRWWVARIQEDGSFAALPMELAKDGILMDHEFFCGPGCVVGAFNAYVDKMTQRSTA